MVLRNNWGGAGCLYVWYLQKVKKKRDCLERHTLQQNKRNVKEDS